MQLYFEQQNKYPDYFVLFQGITDKVSKTFDLSKDIEFELNFIKPLEIQNINKDKRNIDKPTDVLSFPNLNIKCGKIDKKKFKLDVNPETKNLMLGQIVICLDAAKSQAKEYNHSLIRELCYLFVHGLLHLLGFDHIYDSDKKTMRKFEEEILTDIIF